MPSVHAIMQSNNLFLFGMHNPVFWSDPSGLSVVAAIIAAAGIVKKATPALSLFMAGGTVAVAADFTMQMTLGGVRCIHQVNWQSVTVSFFSGGISGIAGGLFVGAQAWQIIATHATITVADRITYASWTGAELTLTELGISAVVAAAISGATIPSDVQSTLVMPSAYGGNRVIQRFVSDEAAAAFIRNLVNVTDEFIMEFSQQGFEVILEYFILPGSSR